MFQDFTRHNEEVLRVWEAYRAGRPVRVPMIIGCNARMLLLDPALNKRKITFREYTENPEVMFQVQLAFLKWLRFNVPQDAAMGYPEKHWEITVDLQNFYEASWFGSAVHYREGQVPDTLPILAGDRKNLLFDRGIPEPISGPFKIITDYFEFFRAKADKGFAFEGFPVKPGPPWSAAGTDGVMTAAVNLRGEEIFTDFYEDPEYVRKLFDFITIAAIKRCQVLRKYFGLPEKDEVFSFADDSVANISTAMYREFVLPYHKKLKAAFSLGKTAIHLCGDSTRHFKTMAEELNVVQFDTGFPVDFGWLRKELGEQMEIQGGPHIALLLKGTPTEVERETLRVLKSGITRGGKFIIREGNNLAPGTPVPNLEAMYATVKKHGGLK